MKKKKSIICSQKKLASQEQVKGPNKCNKISEQRRLRLKELSAEIERLNKNLREKSRMLKMKENTDKKLSQLGNVSVRDGESGRSSLRRRINFKFTKVQIQILMV